MNTIPIDKWFGKNGVKIGDSVNKYFCLEWGKKYKPKSDAFWINKKPTGFRIVKTVKWKVGHLKCKISICFKGNFDYSKEESLLKHYKEIDTDIKNIPILKSNLQKCIRRNIVNKSIKTSYNLIETDFLQFIRRISIIMLEDCVIDSSFTTIVWMTSAFPEWEPNFIVKSWLLGLVYYLSDCKIREIYNKGVKFNILNFINDINSLDDVNKSIIYSLEFRKSYGGMKGDMDMISYFSYTWFKRFVKKKKKFEGYIKNKKKNIKIEIPLSILDIEIASIDFHIFPISNILYKKFHRYSKKSIEKAIWFKSSSLSNKSIAHFSSEEEKIENIYEKIWDKIKKDYIKLSYYFLKSNINVYHSPRI